MVLFILSNNLKDKSLTPQEVGDWFGWEKKGKKKSLQKKKGFCFLEGKKKDFFCFKNSVVSVSGKKKKKKIFTKPNKQVVCWFTKKEILVQGTRKGFEP